MPLSALVPSGQASALAMSSGSSSDQPADAHSPPNSTAASALRHGATRPHTGLAAHTSTSHSSVPASAGKASIAICASQCCALDAAASPDTATPSCTNSTTRSTSVGWQRSNSSLTRATCRARASAGSSNSLTPNPVCGASSPGRVEVGHRLVGRLVSPPWPCGLSPRGGAKASGAAARPSCGLVMAASTAICKWLSERARR